MGKSIEQTAEEAIDAVLPAGSPESLAATQKLLQGRGATLLPSQVMRTGLDGFRERIATTGLVSREKMADNIEAVNNALVEELNLLFVLLHIYCGSISMTFISKIEIFLNSSKLFGIITKGLIFI